MKGEVVRDMSMLLENLWWKIMCSYVGWLFTQHWSTLTHIKIALMALSKASSDNQQSVNKRKLRLSQVSMFFIAKMQNQVCTDVGVFASTNALRHFYIYAYIDILLKFYLISAI